MKFKQFFWAFIRILYKRLERGYEEYGDVSFDRPLLELLNELEEEIYDIFGWGFIMLVKIQKLKQLAQDVEEKLKAREGK